MILLDAKHNPNYKDAQWMWMQIRELLNWLPPPKVRNRINKGLEKILKDPLIIEAAEIIIDLEEIENGKEL